MVEMEGVITNHIVCILIDPVSNLSYVSPQTLEKCKLKQVKHGKPWFVQLATKKKKNVTRFIPSYQFIMNGISTQVTLNILLL
jgi:hypothetical protein